MVHLDFFLSNEFPNILEREFQLNLEINYELDVSLLRPRVLFINSHEKKRPKLLFSYSMVIKLSNLLNRHVSIQKNLEGFHPE